jgi:hypothetical protein
MAAKRTLRTRIVRAVTDAMWERDQCQMRAIDALLAPLERGRQARRSSRRRPKPRRRS